MYVEVDSSPNCDTSVFLRFREQGPSRAVSEVRLYERVSTGEWCAVTGLQGDGPDALCPARAQPVEDSGAGMVYLVWGGLWGIRLKPVSLEEPWNLDSPRQWGEPYLLLADLRDIRFADEKPTS
jgi:hypothetical protein